MWTRRGLMAGAAAGSVGMGWPARAAARKPRIGVLTDMTGLYADAVGRGSVLAVQMAIEDASATQGGPAADMVFADHQNKADVGATITREWIDRGGVDVVVDLINSAVALSVGSVVRDKNKVSLISGASSSDLTGKDCTPNSIAWTYDTYMLSVATARGVLQAGHRKWFNIVADYSFGHNMAGEVRRVVEDAGGTILGQSLAPLGTADFSSFLLEARASGADAVGLINAGGDTVNSIKQAAEFGLMDGKQTIVALVLYITDVHAIGLQVARGLQFTTGWYWNLNDGTAAWARRFAARNGGNFPTQLHAGNYSAVLHYLKAVAAGADAADGRAVVAAMKQMPTNDALFGQCSIRIDGRMLHDVYLCEVKAPAESRASWDYFKILRTIPAAEAWRPLADGGCPLARA